MPNARLTHHQRQMRRARRTIEADVTAAAHKQLRWLWRELMPLLRQLKARREQRVKKLAKQYQLAGANSLWDEFARRLEAALLAALTTGAVSLAQIETAWLRSIGQDIGDIDPAAIVDAYRDQIGAREGREIKGISDATRRVMGDEIATWYRTPGATYGQLIDTLRQQVSDVRAARIGSTETTALNSALVLNTMNLLGLSQWFWDTLKDELVCDKPIDGPDGRGYKGCADLQGRVFTIRDVFPPDASHPT